ncbi:MULTISPECIES: GxxExxY protein [Calothrix]|uniref:GxxExxY protein n=2 Tax=Calothrix TaxID=1186 RepID=A0ABR8A6M7_9CYAN|nr:MULTISPECIES: GxxExxY protein [Calothrix]MBD2195075.1 GxxExxY protein [Calothrix parietina FACHB-288]MBD2223673.1 GxxExxY protein [Calothrix anomala FACHB-343]
MEMNRRGAENTERRELERRMTSLTGEVIGAAIEVHRLLGPGFLEEVYKEALIVEFLARGIPHECEKSVTVTYKGHEVGTSRLDFLVANCLVLELKAVQNLAPIHEAKVLSYLKITNCSLALLINFNVHLLKDGIKRIILSS